MSATHNTWLNLIDRSGPFLSVQVLESALPQGLDIIHTKFRQKLRRAYELWQEDIDNGELQEAFHYGWVDLVLKEILEYDDKSLFLNGEIKYTNEELGTEYSSKYLVKSPISNKIRFFIDVLPPGTEFDKPLEGDKWPASLIEKMTLLCRSQKVRYGLLTNGEKWTIVTAPIGATSGTATWYSRLWRYEPVTLKAFQTLLGARRCFGPESETLDALLDNSLNSYEEVTSTLGEQVRRAVEVLIQSLDSADQDRNRELLKDVSPAELYDASVTVMMRLVFLLCAEERGLLLLGDPTYDQFYAITTLRAQLAEEAGRIGPEVLERRHDAWSRLLATFRTVYGGIEHETLRLPPLGGSLFDPDKYPFLEGRKAGSSWNDTEAAPLPINNRTVLLLLTALQILEQKGGALYLSYRALDVEQIGHVYEGLLDQTVLRIPETMLGIQGSKQKEHLLLPLKILEQNYDKGTLLSYLENETGKKSTTIEKLLKTSVSETEYGELLLACGGDEKITEKTKSFFWLLRRDIWSQPQVYLKDSYVVTSGQDRRESGAHYTPQSLTEDIVKRTLEPVVYTEEAGIKVLKSSFAILNLKICDSAMGSAAFLVQACRYLAETLVLAWDKESQHEWQKTGIQELPSLTHDRLIFAKQLIAERCLYGVDINPLAVELAKLSLWLITMSKGKPFEFLDHHFKSGDTLLGIQNKEQLSQISFVQTEAGGQKSISEHAIEVFLNFSLSKRKNIHSIYAKDITDIAHISKLNLEADLDIHVLKVLADTISGIALKAEGKIQHFEKLIQSLEPKLVLMIQGHKESLKEIILENTKNLRIEHRGKTITKKPFHWVLEFPEVFEDGGFDAIIGNPPFLGGKKISSAHSLSYLQYLINFLVTKGTANSDLCSFFMLRNHSLIKEGGFLGLLLSSAISEGETRQSIERILNSKSNIINASSRFPWPGKASVTIAIIVFHKGSWNGKIILNDKEVNSINSLLSDEMAQSKSPIKLQENSELSYVGSYPNGKGFVISTEEAKNILSDKKYEKVIWPYLVGQELNADPYHSPSKWIINFHNWPIENEAKMKGIVASDYPLCLDILRERVYPERTRKDKDGNFVLRKPLPQRWWQYADKRPELYSKLESLQFSYAIATQATKYVAFGRVAGKTVFSHSIAIIASDDYALGAAISSSLHEIWARKFGGYNLLLIRYSPSDLLETFPFPVFNITLRKSGEEYFAYRELIMKDKGIGLTDLLNLLHDPNCSEMPIKKFRTLQEKVDHETCSAYGWLDIPLEHGFHETDQGIRFTISAKARTSLLNALSKLNNERAILNNSEKKTSAKSKLTRTPKNQSDRDLEERE